MADDLEKQFREGFLAAVRERINELLPGDGERLCAEIERLWPSIYESRKTLVVDPASEGHLRSCSLVLAAHRLLAPQLPRPDQAIEVIRNAFIEAAKRMGSADDMLAAAFSGTSDPLEVYVGMAKAKETGFYGATFAFEHARDDKDAFHQDVTKCFYFDFFKAEGVPELTRMFCDSDEIWMDALNRGHFGIRVERPTTLAFGGTGCPFHVDRSRS
ncbi:MAG: L-2-amino-thiazoline-4-carboxylic acid hydrolase [Planctomycetes bacterium]|nr:L-2-amino-thiazoline-4-carboxylic acid hydrolase [Planctomycetota bacterium]